MPPFTTRKDTYQCKFHKKMRNQCPEATSTGPRETPETLRVRSCRCYAFGCMVAIREGYRMARGWHKLSLSSALLLPFSGMLFLLLFLSPVLFLFCFVFMLSLEICNVPLIFSCPADHVPERHTLLYYTILYYTILYYSWEGVV